MRKLLVLLAVAVLVVMTGSLAMAGGTSDVTVSARIVGTCHINSNTPVAFGDLDQSSSSAATATGTVVFWCTKNATYTLTDEANSSTGDGTFSGTMSASGTTDTIPYTLTYTPYSGAGAGVTSPITSTISGTIANADYVTKDAGNYSDTVTFTIAP